MPTEHTTSLVADPPAATNLRVRLLRELRAHRAARGRTLGGTIATEISAPVAEALLTVPRHLFVPELEPTAAYADEPFVLKQDAEGRAFSSVSAPSVVAMQLDQLNLNPGDRVLEIGAGGYGAALVREIVGPTGTVVSIDIDPEVTGRAQRLLTAAGYADVTVVTSDAVTDIEGHGPFTKILVTAEIADLPPAWLRVLALGGRIVAPLRLAGVCRSVSLVHEAGHHDGRLRAEGYGSCGLDRLQGPGRYPTHRVAVGQSVVLEFDDVPAGIDPAALARALDGPRAEAWSQVVLKPDDVYDGQNLWLAGHCTGFGLLSATQDAVTAGIVKPTSRLGTPVIADGGSFAYRTVKALHPDTVTEVVVGARGYGPDGKRLAWELADEITRGGAHPDPARIHLYPAGTGDQQLLPAGAGIVLERPHSRIVIGWT